MVWNRAGETCWPHSRRDLLAAVRLMSRAALLLASCRFANGVWMCGKDVLCGGWRGQVQVRLPLAPPVL